MEHTCYLVSTHHTREYLFFALQLSIVLLDYDGAGSATHGRTHFNHDLVWDLIKKRRHSQALRTVPQTIYHHLHEITLLNPARLRAGAIHEN